MITVCNLCRSDTQELVHRNVLGRNVNLVRCTACGFKFYDKMLAPPQAVYSSEEQAEKSFKYKTLVAARQTDGHIQSNERHCRTVYSRMLDTIEKVLGRTPKRLYEVGCAWGLFLTEARSRGIQVAGCDMNPHNARLGQSLGLDIQGGDFLQIAVPQGQDVVVLLDVMEHVWQPREVLEKCVYLLNPGGVVLIKTFYDEFHSEIELDLSPSSAGLSRTGPNRGYFEPVAHPSHFDLPVLKGLFQRCGLRVVDTTLDTHWGQVTLVGGV